MGSGSSSPRHSLQRQSSNSPKRVQSWRFMRTASGLSYNEVGTESPSTRGRNWVHPSGAQNGGWAASAPFAVASFECHLAAPLQAQPHAPANISTQFDSSNQCTRVIELSDCDSPNSVSDCVSPKCFSGVRAYADAAGRPAMVNVLDMIEASVNAGRSKLPVEYVLPLLVKCRESIASSQNDVRQCASALHALGERLQNCKVVSGNGHSCAPEVEMVFQLVLRVRQESPGAELEVAESLLALARYYRSEGRFKEAIKHFQHLVGILSCQVGKRHPSVAAALNFLAESLAHANRFWEAEYACKRAIAIATATLGEEHHHTQGFRRNLEAVWAMKERYESGVSSRMAGGGTGQSSVGVNVTLPA